MSIRADMHVHTHYSDGLLTPVDAVHLAVKNGVNLLAVTDHDNMLSCAEVSDLCRQNGILHVKGLEISAYQGSTKVHVLGYGLDETSPAYIAFYQKIVDGSLARCVDVLQKLKKGGINVSLDEVLRERFSRKAPVHTMHVARAATRKGYASSAGSFYLAYLNAGKVGYSSVGRPTPQEAVELIKTCGGFSSLAHPGRISLDKEPKLQLVHSLCECGLNGIEAFYSAHTVEETAYYKELANSLNLLCTGGSDTHVQGGSREIGTPEFHPSQDLLAALHLS